MTLHEAADPAWRPRLAAAGLTTLGDLLRHTPPAHWPGQWQRLTKPGLGGRERWRWVLADGTVLYVKRYLRTPAAEQLDRLRRQTFSHSRAWWEYDQSAALRSRYVPAVRAIAAVEEMYGPYELRSAVVFEQVRGEALDRVWPPLVRSASPLTRASARQELTRSLARFVSAFHQTGACHRDLYLCHIFADLVPGSSPPGFTLIDLARTQRPRWRRLRWLIKDLAQLDFSARQIGATRADRLRFLVTYLGLQPNAPRVRYYARRITRKSDRIARRAARRSRPS